jgi:WD40 repeat protein
VQENDYDYATIAYDATTGALLWKARYKGPGHSYDAATSLAASPDGTKVYVTGYSWQGASYDYDYVTLAYEAASGDVLWEAHYNGPASDADDAYSVTASPDGSTVFVTGGSNGSNGEPDYATVAYGS